MQMRFVQSFVGRPAVLLLSMFAGVSVLAGQSFNALTISVDDPRPLSAAVTELEKTTGWIVTYEDPPWVFAGDLQDRAILIGRPMDPSKPDPVPLGGTCTFSGVPPRGDALARVDFVRALVQAYEESPVGRAQFDIIQTGGVIHVVPAWSRDTTGRLQSRRSVRM